MSTECTLATRAKAGCASAEIDVLSGGDGALLFWRESAAPAHHRPYRPIQIPCLIKNTGNPQAPGTLIGASRDEDDLPVKGISNLNNMAMFNVSGPGMKGMVGMAARVFATMSRAGISVVLITQSSSEYSISFCVPQSDCARAKRAMEDEFYLELKEGLLEPLAIMERLAIISVVGDGMRTLRGISAKFLPRWLAPISISWRLLRAPPSAPFRWWLAMTMLPPACA